MANPNFFILYVDSPIASTAFYADVLERAPVESSPTFAMFALDSGVMLGLWSKHTVEPSSTAVGGGAEVAFCVESDQAVASLYKTWTTRGLSILQKPVRLDFGYTFVARDPDGHRLRVFAPSAP